MAFLIYISIRNFQVLKFRMMISRLSKEHCDRKIFTMTPEDVDYIFYYYHKKYSYEEMLWKYPFRPLKLEKFFTEEEINKLKS